ncbi:MAG: glycosyltransferase family 4 protein [Alphaproteobacteria bacterium]|nr:glycosyltransferase family 4 protein [Alphaproteobacteria bacterium]
MADPNTPFSGPVGFVLKGYPRLSETFIAQEIHALEQRGLRIQIFSLRHPTDKARHPIHDEIAAPVTYLPEYLHDEPGRVWRGWRVARRLDGYDRAFQQWRRDLLRDPTPNRIRRFGQAMVLAAELPASIRRLHFHFLHTPASVTRYAALMREIPFSGSAHAKDIYTIPDWEKAEKLRDIDWLTTCTRAGAAYLHALNDGMTAHKVHLDYHGLDFSRFPADPTRAPSDILQILSVGRAVEKKGYDDLLTALSLLPETLNWRFIHIGGGALTKALKRQAGGLGLTDRIEWRGALPQGAVLKALRQSDLFVLSNKIASDGDRDGLPNVLMEAQSQSLPVIATRVSATPELILDGETGLLVPPGDPAALANAIESLAQDSERRRRLGAAGATRVRGRFTVDACIAGLAQRFGLPADAAPAQKRAG